MIDCLGLQNPPEVAYFSSSSSVLASNLIHASVLPPASQFLHHFISSVFHLVQLCLCVLSASRLVFPYPPKPQIMLFLNFRLFPCLSLPVIVTPLHHWHYRVLMLSVRVLSLTNTPLAKQERTVGVIVNAVTIRSTCSGAHFQNVTHYVTLLHFLSLSLFCRSFPSHKASVLSLCHPPLLLGGNYSFPLDTH